MPTFEEYRFFAESTEGRRASEGLRVGGRVFTFESQAGVLALSESVPARNCRWPVEVRLESCDASGHAC